MSGHCCSVSQRQRLAWGFPQFDDPAGGPHLELKRATFPLTPALSLWEREKPRAAPGRQGAHGLAASRGVFLPLPEGEGRGEGEPGVGTAGVPIRSALASRNAPELPYALAPSIVLRLRTAALLGHARRSVLGARVSPPAACPLGRGLWE